MTEKPNPYNEQDMQQAVNILRGGGIILYPTDTIWGIGCDATNEAAVEKIIRLKNRPGAKSFVVLAASEKEVLQYVASPDLAVFDYLATVKKPTTVIYRQAVGLAVNAVADDGSVAIRITSDIFCRHLIKRLQKPVISTSANVSGEASPADFQSVSKAIINGVDYCVIHRQGESAENSTPSSIIKWVNGQIELIRP